MREETRQCGVVIIDMNTGEIVEDSQSEESSEQAEKKQDLPRHIPSPQPRLQVVVPSPREEKDTYKPWLF